MYAAVCGVFHCFKCMKKVGETVKEIKGKKEDDATPLSDNCKMQRAAKCCAIERQPTYKTFSTCCPKQQAAPPLPAPFAAHSMNEPTQSPNAVPPPKWTPPSQPPIHIPPPDHAVQPPPNFVVQPPISPSWHEPVEPSAPPVG